MRMVGTATAEQLWKFKNNVYINYTNLDKTRGDKLRWFDHIVRKGDW